MVYGLDKYVEAFPKRNVSTLKKFTTESKNLHEMSTDEINAIIATWGGVTSATAFNQKSIIKMYFDWLAQNGFPVRADIDSIVIPIKAAEFLIYSSEILHEYWSRFLASCEREATKTGETFNRNRYLSSYVADILSFYGLTAEQILALTLSDVQPNGVSDYELPLTKADIDILLEYKGLTEFANNKKINGYHYIRSAGIVRDEVLDRGINQGACEYKDKYLKRLLTFRNVYKLGRYAEIYAEEKRIGKPVDLSNRVIPADWFLKKIELIVGNELKTNRITAYKKDYGAYRKERMEYEAKNNAEYIAKIDNAFEQLEKPTVDRHNLELSEALRYINTTIVEIDKMKKDMLSVKAMLQKIVDGEK